MVQWDDETADILFSPWVLRSAWKKVCRWYAAGEWYDPAEFLAWRSDPWRHLADLALELKRGTYVPSPFPEVPYPKKGSYTRHYVMPSVRDQVAFMVFAVLLGPFFEARMPNVSFGNRLYRPRVLKPPAEVETCPSNSKVNQKRWFRAPFSLSHQAVYDSFPTSYGLFRRLLQWITNRAVLGSDVPVDDGEFNKEDPDRLPYLDRLRDYRGRDFLWARLDLSMAYPSIERELFGKTAAFLMQNQVGCSRRYVGWGRPKFPSLESPESKGFKSWLEPGRVLSTGHPWHYLVEEEQARVNLARQLATLITKIRYAPWEKPGEWTDPVSSDGCWGCGERKKCAERRADTDYWYGPHGIVPLGCEHTLLESGSLGGLPTGLAISGLLLNVSLTPVDERMCAFSDEIASQGGHVFYLRFVDDIVILAEEPKDLEKALERLSQSLEEFCGSRVRLNTTKAKPDGVRKYLDTRCRTFLEDGGKLSLADCLRPGDYLTRSNLELFTTNIVREMSELDDESLEERFGAAGIQRLEQLMELAAQELEDFEVAADARLSFAVNKIARAAWPKGQVVCDDRVLSADSYVKKILLIAETALRKHQWRFKLWKAILIIALRASQPFYQQDYGQEWLFKHVLPLVAWSGPGASAPGSSYSLASWETEYENRVPEHCPRKKEICRYQEHRCRERVSFHRAHFWRAWAELVRTLTQIARDEGAVSYFPGSWTAFFTPETASRALQWFSQINDIARKMYNGGRWGWDQDPFFWWWEAEALVHAVLTARPVPLSQLTQLGQPRAQLLRHPERVGLEYLAAVLGAKDGEFSNLIEEALRRVFGTESRGPSEAAADRCQAYAGVWADLYEIAGLNDDNNMASPSIFPSPPDPSLAVFGNLGLRDLFHDYVLRYATRTIEKPQTEPEWSSTWKDFFLFQSYANIRRLLLAHGVPVPWRLFKGWFRKFTFETRARRKPVQYSLHEAVYSVDECSSSHHPAETPALPVNPRLATVIASQVSAGSDKLISPSTVKMSRSQFDSIREIRRAVLLATNDRVIPSIKGNWKTRACQLGPGDPAPHPLFIFPELFRLSQDAGEWRRAVLLLWLLDGSEHILNELLMAAPYRLPLTDREDLRARFLLPARVWDFVERALGCTYANGKGEGLSVESIEADQILTRITVGTDGMWFVDTEQRNEGMSALAEYLRARLVQLVAEPSWRQWLPSRNRPFFASTEEAVCQISEEMARRLDEARNENRLSTGKATEAGAESALRDMLIMLPEWCVAPSHVRALKQFSRETGIAVLGGLLPRELPRAVPTVRSLRATGLRCLVNEAILLLPDSQPTSVGKEFELPTKVYEFRIRKCSANVDEIGLVRALEEEIRDTRWRFVGGEGWSVFTYPGWGSFTVMICSDVLTGIVWQSLAHQIQHLFIPAFNKNVDLFDQATWTRGYELYANVLCANHGSYGGSVAWTPKHGYNKEVFRAHGSRQGLVSVVMVPVKSLVEAQRRQYDCSLQQRVTGWKAKMTESSTTRPQENAEYTTPPPRVRRCPE